MESRTKDTTLQNSIALLAARQQDTLGSLYETESALSLVQLPASSGPPSQDLGMPASVPYQSCMLLYCCSLLRHCGTMPSGFAQTAAYCE